MKIVLADDDGTVIDTVEDVFLADVTREVDRNPTGLLSSLNLRLIR